jgi:hypothetical protein
MPTALRNVLVRGQSPKTARRVTSGQAHLMPRSFALKSLETSVRPTQYECERHHENLDTEVITDAQHPIPAILCAVRHDERPHNSCSPVARFNQIFDSCAALINQYPSITGAMKIDVGHIPPPRLHFDSLRSKTTFQLPDPRRCGCLAVLRYRPILNPAFPFLSQMYRWC